MADPIQYQSAIPALVQSLIGSTQKDTSTSSANIDPLMQVFGKAMTAQGAGVPEMQQLLTSIFQEGAKQVPELSNAFANATGSRTTGNSSLALALGDLNRKMTTDAATAIINNQNTNRQLAGQAGAQIAGATKSTTSEASKNPNFKSTYAPLLAGFALNKADKSGLLGKAWDSITGGSSTAGDINTMSGFTNAPGGELGYPNLPTDASGNLTGNLVQDASGVFVPDSTASAAIDPSFTDNAGNTSFGVVDPSVGFQDAAGFPSFGAVDTSVADSLAGTAGDIFSDFGFADGGLVGRDFNPAGKKINRETNDRKQDAKGYADGGIVRNKNYEGTVDPQSNLVTALNSAARPSQVTKKAGNGSSTGNSNDDSGGIGVTDASNTGGVTASPASIGPMSQGLAINALSMALGLPGIVAAVVNGLTGGQSVAGTGLSAAGNAVSDAASSVGHSIGVTVGPMSVSDDNTAANDTQSGIANDVSGLDTSAMSAVGAVDGGIDGTNGAASDGGVSDGGGTSAGSGVGGGPGDGYRKGGKVSGPGTGTSDSIPARLSDGEYVIPADVVRHFGASMFDKMVAMVHKPVAAMKGGKANGGMARARC